MHENNLELVFFPTPLTVIGSSAFKDSELDVQVKVIFMSHFDTPKSHAILVSFYEKSTQKIQK